MRAPTEHLGGWARRALLLLIIPAALSLSAAPGPCGRRQLSGLETLLECIIHSTLSYYYTGI